MFRLCSWINQKKLLPNYDAVLSARVPNKMMTEISNWVFLSIVTGGIGEEVGGGGSNGQHNRIQEYEKAKKEKSSVIYRWVKLASNVQLSTECNVFDECGVPYHWLVWLAYRCLCNVWSVSDTPCQWKQSMEVNRYRLSAMRKCIGLLLQTAERPSLEPMLFYRQRLGSPTMCQCKHYRERIRPLSTRRVGNYRKLIGAMTTARCQCTLHLPDSDQRLDFYRLKCCPSSPSTAPISSSQFDWWFSYRRHSIEIKHNRGRDTRMPMNLTIPK